MPSFVYADECSYVCMHRVQKSVSSEPHYSLVLILSLNLELGWKPESPRDLPGVAPPVALRLQAFSCFHVGARALNSDPSGSASSLNH